MFTQDPLFWRAGAMSSVIIMVCILAFLTVDSLRAIEPGGSHVPPYTVINRHIAYEYDDAASAWRPVIGGNEPLFGKTYTADEAARLIRTGKLVMQSRACMDCHTFLGNGAYFAPDLTKAWLDPAWHRMWMPMTQTHTTEDAMAAFLMHPDRYATWNRRMPDLRLTRDEAEAMVAYLKWMSSIDTNGFPNAFGRGSTGTGEDPH